MELGPRDIISRAEVLEFEKGNGFEGPYGNYMHLDVRHLGEAVINRKLPFMRELGEDYVGIDIVKEPIPVRPVQHYMMGGVDTDINAATSVDGLYAAGECANAGLNGANRLGSNSLSECLVFGAAAGRSAAHYATEAKTPTANPVDALLRDETKRVEKGFLQKDGKKAEERIGPIREAMQKAMDDHVGVFRTAERLQENLKILDGLRTRFEHAQLYDHSRVFNTELTQALELDFMLEIAEVITVAALDRKESRGAQARRDYPERDDEHYLANSLATRSESGGPPKIDYRPVRITHWEPKARTY
jgi:fumarate reductase flavoprotein subunit